MVVRPVAASATAMRRSGVSSLSVLKATRAPSGEISGQEPAVSFFGFVPSKFAT